MSIIRLESRRLWKPAEELWFVDAGLVLGGAGPPALR